MSFLYVALGAAIGAPLRYLVDRAVQARHDSVFPWGTFTVNAIGSLILGILIGGATTGAVPATITTILGTGLCGTLTTYSTFGFETIRLLQQHARFYAVANAAASIIAGLGAALLGTTIAQALWS